ncbi:Cytoplasmic dynein 2 light intermediate chain 1 [Halocaridina rubra]|uniref:Cytoplasmic dynein 2 light intermediate chain 1 n=1 Tax=Halocaridina rubra TaxID=373956 RepID=A0AAN8WM22_HALRR
MPQRVEPTSATSGRSVGSAVSRRVPSSAAGVRVAGSAVSGRAISSTSTRSNSISGLSVWDIAVSEARKKRSDPQYKAEADKVPRESTVLLVGTRAAGKTTLLQRFLDREDQPRNTLALEYTYGRKTGKTLVKEVCHLWELGGGALFTALLATPLTTRALPNLTVIIMIDLSKPETIWSDLEALLSSLKSELNAVLEKAPELKAQLEAASWNRVGQDHQDKAYISPFIVPLVILGGKYDIFQDMEPESKKVVCRALRFIAHSNGASLQFFSARDAGLIKKSKELLSHFAFGTVESKSLAQDYNKPLIIPAGSDNLQTISGNVDDSSKMNYDAWKHTFHAKFPQKNEEKSALPEDPGRDPSYAEPDVDNLRAQKDEELERIRREVGRNSARWAELDLS